MSRTYIATKSKVGEQGHPPDSFLDTLIDCGKAWPDDVCAVNAEPGDIYGKVRSKWIIEDGEKKEVPILGPWTSALHRKAAMLEVLRVLAGYESSWNWNEGVDTTNAHSMAHPEGQETGAFQVSYDSSGFGNLRAFLASRSVANATQFIMAMKYDPALACEYAARLLRIRTDWDGPINRGEVQGGVSRDAVAEFQMFLAAP